MAFRFHLIATAGALFLTACAASYAADWENTLSPFAPGPFPEARPLRVQYTFGWNNLTAATANLHLTKADGRFHLEGSGSTIGLARSLWKFEGKHTAITDAKTLRPVHVHESEAVRSKTSETDVNFTPEGVTSQREQRQGATVKSKTRSFDFPHAMSLSSSLLYLRSRPLTDGAVERVVVYPSTSAYLATITVVARERLTVPAGNYEAIKLDLQLNKIGKERALQPHKKFKRATIWISNDPDRLVLRIEAQVFIGTVFGELQSVAFDNGNHAALSTTR